MVVMGNVGTGDFGSALFDPDKGTPAGLVGPDGKTAPKRFNVYRNNVMVSLCEAVGQTYPAVQALLGEEYFTALARIFVSEHKPKSPVLLWYGEEFPEFVGTFPPLEAYPYLADVARLEWEWLQAYHAADEDILDPAALGAIDPEAIGSVRFKSHSATRLISSKWPVLDLIRKNRFSPEDAIEIDLGKAQSAILVRPDLDVGIYELRPGGEAFVAGLIAGLTLGEAAANAQASHEEFSLSDSLSDCLSYGAFSSLYLEE